MKMLIYVHCLAGGLGSRRPFFKKPSLQLTHNVEEKFISDHRWMVCQMLPLNLCLISCIITYTTYLQYKEFSGGSYMLKRSDVLAAAFFSGSASSAGTKLLRLTYLAEAIKYCSIDASPDQVQLNPVGIQAVSG